jgi:diaminopimelate decarboxylase
MEAFAHDPDGHLRGGGVALADIAARVGTPTYVYDQSAIEGAFDAFAGAFAPHPHLVCFAVKANPSRAVLALLARRGAGADVVSGGELARALRAGVPAGRVMFSGVGKAAAEIAEALEAGILAFGVESEAELELIARLATARGTVAPVSLRFNPEIDAATHPYIATGLSRSKFGMPGPQVRGLLARLPAMAGVRLVGLACHIGSQILSVRPLAEALDALVALADEARAAGHALEVLDMGGGLGISYGPEHAPSPGELAEAALARVRGRSERLVLEPGRALVGNAGVLLTRVLRVKRGADRTFVVVDAGMNDLVRPALYQAHHGIVPVCRRAGEVEVEVDVVGPVCESADTFATGRAMALPGEGDLLAVLGAGAYGFSMASSYNSRPRAAEVLVRDGRFAVIRSRESRRQMLAGERLPGWLEPGTRE